MGWILNESYRGNYGFMYVFFSIYNIVEGQAFKRFVIALTPLLCFQKILSIIFDWNVFRWISF